ncbi:MAG: MAE_28990/MAE_18760 family HEPN-like nuclease [Acidobacteriota bacterium]|nr:MAE_28990/MAE_18760 family HEPN-like nuclease [Acidobacteriota bacterium]
MATLDEKRARLSVDYGGSRRTRKIDDQIVKILKANCFLLIYNLVEASVRESFRTLYASVEADGSTVRSLRQNLRGMWVDAAVDRLRNQEGGHTSYRDVARRLVEQAVNNGSATLRVEELRAGGNLDADNIRRACQDHGVQTTTHPRARGGQQLRLVRQRRNDLAHGNLSFSECGRDYTLGQLLEVRHESVLFVRGILRNIERYIARREFRA